MSERTIAVIDGNSLLHRAFHGLPPTMTAPDGRPTNAVFGFTTMLFKLVTDLAPDGVVVAFDRGKPAFRIEALAQYKVQRPPTDPDLKVQFPMVKELLGALGVPIVELEGWEGDDILGTLAERASAEGMRVLLVTGDKDALQLVSDQVSVVSTKKGITDIVVYDRDAVIERYGVAPEQVADFLGLKGDSSDNIPGVPGVGEKTAAKLLQEYGTLDAVLEHAAEVKGKLGENLREHTEAARASRLVATIRRDVPLEVDLDAIEWGLWDDAEALGALSALSFTSLIPRLRAMRGAVAPPGVVPETAAVETAWRRIERSDAEAWVDTLVTGAPATHVGVALGDGDETCLFPEERVLALASGGTVALMRGASAERAWGRVLDSCRVSASDVKALMEGFCPPGRAGSEAHEAAADAAYAADPAHLFDCGIAGYLLASNKSDYGLAALAAEHLGRSLEPGDPGEEARAAAELAPVLGDALGKWGATPCFETIEMPLVPVLVRMERVGVGIDRDVLAALSAETHAQIEALIGEIHELAGCEFTIDSPKQLGEVLFDKLGLPAGKRTKTGFSTDASVLADLAALHPIAGKIVAYRELTKLTSTYIDALPRLVGEDGRLHTTFNQTVAATGRLSSSSPNLQNIPVRTELGRRIRAAFVPARAGDLIVGADYSQIELRILAHLSEDAGLIEAFTSGADFHAATAARVFGVEPDAVDPEMRRKAKAVNFGIVYGISSHGLSESLGVGYAEAQATIDRYFAAYPRVRAYLDETVAEAHKTGYAETLYGRRRPIPELKSSNWNLRSFGERTAMNHPMQGTAADLMKLAMIEVDRRLRAEHLASRMVLQVHDELVFEAPADELEALTVLVREAMSGVAELRVPLEVSVGSGTDWASAK
ncbi:MAG: DNA polymerase I [Coriobacteriia bacterium]|nr:DNA polymerase I [Coriobacteriia bacterium]